MQSQQQQRFNQSYLSGYWVGPAGILVSDFIDMVKDMDDVNVVFRDGHQTNCQIQCHYRLKYDAYMTKYAVVGSDGLLYYNEHAISPEQSALLTADPNSWVIK